MASPPDDPSVYAPPRDYVPDFTPDPLQPRGTGSPVLVGFIAILCTSAITALIALIVMSLWHAIVPKSSGFLAGLGEFLVAVGSWMALTAFGGLTSIILAVSILGRGGRPSFGALIAVAMLAIAAAVVCFLPVKGGDPDGFRGALGMLSEAAIGAMIFFSMRHARQKYLRPELPFEVG